jgi:hypothetical protein
MPSALRDSRLGGVNPSASKLRWARRRGAPIARQVSASDGWLRSSRNVVGPGSGRLRHLATRGWEELILQLQSYDGREGKEPNRAPGVRFRWTAEIFSKMLWAQALDAFGTSRLVAGRS